jgi:hypothetical protein
LWFGTPPAPPRFLPKAGFALAQNLAGPLADVDAADCGDPQLLTDAVGKAELAGKAVCRMGARACLGAVDDGDGLGLCDSATHAPRSHHERANRVFGAGVVLHPHHKPAVEVFGASGVHAACMPLDFTAANSGEVEAAAATPPCERYSVLAHSAHARFHARLGAGHHSTS